MKLYKIGRIYCYYHRTYGWLIYRKGDWNLSLQLGVYNEDDLILPYGVRTATPAQFKKNTGKDVRRTIKTYTQRRRRALQRLKELLNGTRIEKDDIKFFCGGDDE